MDAAEKIMAPPVVRMSAEHSDKLRRLQLLYDAGVLNAENFEEKRQRLLDELQPKPTANPPTAVQLGSAPHISAHVTEENSVAVRINAAALLHEYFQHLKEENPETTSRVIPPAGLRPPLVTCTVRCKAGGKVFEETMIGPNKRLVRNEIALSLLQQLMPDFNTPEDIMANIKGMSNALRYPPVKKTPPSTALTRSLPDFDPGLGAIESALGTLGAPLPVVCGDADDISRLLRSLCEAKQVLVPNLLARGFSPQGTLSASMSLKIDQDRTAVVDVEASDLDAVRRAACLGVLQQVFPHSRDRASLKAEVDRVCREEHRRKRQRTGHGQPVYIPPTAQASTLLSYFCQINRVPMPELDRDHRLSLTLPDGRHFAVDACKMNKKIARAEACLRLMKAIFPGKDIDEMQEAVTELRLANKVNGKEAAKAAKAAAAAATQKKPAPFSHNAPGRGSSWRGVGAPAVTVRRSVPSTAHGPPGDAPAPAAVASSSSSSRPHPSPSPGAPPAWGPSWKDA